LQVNVYEVVPVSGQFGDASVKLVVTESPEPDGQVHDVATY